ncbi:MAG TPA: nuclear transport factor 2 family protein [Dyella sp.]|uniref:nuclear transport factor 2 family protein n=1 Tax=Dyella sp. TaxID=1869338 RepID=UPI002D7725C7|nr:nuclear transport factor 2 family protein [Dyella sp.]HET6552656.1 nuclear transport factor 2 family protein [Dyella sp.]
MKYGFALLIGLLLSLPVHATGANDPKTVVLDFYKLAMQEFKPREAFARYAAADFVEHSADSAGGTAASTVTFLEGLIKQFPDPHWEVVRSVAEGDLVFLHVRVTPAPKAPAIAVAEIFRVRNGKIVEHWDVIQHEPAKAVNPNSMF